MSEVERRNPDISDVEINVLFVDDAPIYRAGMVKYIKAILEKILGDAQIVLVEVGNAEEALELLENQDFDLIISDVRMEPGMNGFEFLETCVKKEGFLDETGFIVMSISDEQGNYERADKSGALFVRKGELQELEEGIAKALMRITS